MSKPSPQQSQNTDTALGPLWIIIGIFALIAVIWYVAQPQIVAFVFKVRIAEIHLISLFTPDLNQTAAALRNYPPSQYGGVTADQLETISTTVGNYLRYPILLILSIFAVIIYFGNPVLQYRKQYTMKRLVDLEQHDWPQITPIVKIDLVKEDVDKGPWAMSLTPLQFAKKHQLLREERVVMSGNSIMVEPRMTASILRNETYRVFALQIGPYWNGATALPIHQQALFAIFAARVAGDRDGAFKLTADINRSATEGKLDFSGVQALLTKHHNNKYVQRSVQRHAFVYTALSSLLQLARGDGVLSVADFLWLKPIDRTFWFMMNSVGRQTPFSEVAGPFAHWLAEMQFGRPIRVPMVEQAVNALEMAIKEIIYKPDEEDENDEQEKSDNV